MVSKNDITGDLIKTKTNSKVYRDNWDRIFGPAKKAKRFLKVKGQAKRQEIY